MNLSYDEVTLCVLLPDDHTAYLGILTDQIRSLSAASAFDLLARRYDAMRCWRNVT